MIFNAYTQENGSMILEKDLVYTPKSHWKCMKEDTLAIKNMEMVSIRPATGRSPSVHGKMEF